MTVREFTDARFMSAHEKQLLLKAWTTFVRHGLTRRHLTNRIYEYLRLHGGHIAHFNADGFYAVWLEHGSDRVEFMSRFLAHRSLVDYADIHEAMCVVLREHFDELREQARLDEIERLTGERDALDHKLASLKAAS